MDKLTKQNEYFHKIGLARGISKCNKRAESAIFGMIYEILKISETEESYALCLKILDLTIEVMNEYMDLLEEVRKGALNIILTGDKDNEK